MENNDDTPEAYLTRDVTRATSRYELKKDSQRTKMGMKRKANEGHFPSKAPIGCVNKRDSEDKGYIAIDDKQAFYIEIKESVGINKHIYKNIDLIIKFCNQIPDIFINASVEEKQLLLRMIIDEITYDEGGILQVKLKPIFEALRVIKMANIDSESVKVGTKKKPSDNEILEYLSNFITLAVNSKVRTLETRIISNKKDPEGSNSINGASDGGRTHEYRNHNPGP